MPNIRSMKVDANGIEIVASDGRRYAVSVLGIKNSYTVASGRNATERKVNAINVISLAIVQALGPEQISLADIGLDFNTTTGRPTLLRTGGAGT